MGRDAEHRRVVLVADEAEHSRSARLGKDGDQVLSDRSGRTNIDKLIQLYIIGVFTSFTLGQAGMVRHWPRLIADSDSAATERRRDRLAQALNATGAVITGVVVIIVVCYKFLDGAYLVIVAMVVLFALMKAIRAHYRRVSEELALADDAGLVQPSNNHAVVLVSTMNQAAMRALGYAKATRPAHLTALTVNLDDADTRTLQTEWDRHSIDIPLTVIDSPYREITRPIVDYIRRIRRQSPRDVVTVFIPEYVVGHWNTSWGTGGNNCCTIKARCASRRGCSLNPR
jgi:hypothetical protein